MSTDADPSGTAPDPGSGPSFSAPDAGTSPPATGTGPSASAPDTGTSPPAAGTGPSASAPDTGTSPPAAGTGPSGAGAGTPPTRPGPPGAEFFGRIRAFGIVRPDEGRWVAGVSAGLARRMGIDPLLVRGLFVALTIASGFGVGLYGLAWLFLPHPDGRIHAEGVLHGAVTPGTVGAGLLSLSALNGMMPWGPLLWWDEGWNPADMLPTMPGVILLLAFGVWWMLTRDRHRNGVPPGGAAPHGGDTGGAPGGSPETRLPAYGTPPTPPTPPAPPVPPVPTAPVTPPAAVRTRPARPTRPDPPLRSLTLTVLGLSLLAAATVLLWDRVSPFPGQVAVLCLAVALTVVSGGIVLAGMLGRRSGGLAPVAILLAIAMANTAVVQGTALNLGQRTWRPLTAAAANGHEIGIGDAVLDLTAPGLLAGRTAESPLTVYTRVGTGKLRVILPGTVPAEVQARVGVGSIDANLDGTAGPPTTVTAGTDLNRTVTDGDGAPVLIVQARVGAGNLQVLSEGTGAR